MTHYSEERFLSRLETLNLTLEAVQTLGLWITHYRKYAGSIVMIWLREMKRVPENKKLEFFYLANEVLQTSIQKGTEYKTAFAEVMPNALAHVAATCAHYSPLMRSLDRILIIWRARHVYTDDIIDQFRAILAAGKSPEEVQFSDDEPPKKHSKTSNTSKLPLTQKIREEAIIELINKLRDPPSYNILTRSIISNLPSSVADVGVLKKITCKNEAKALRKEVTEALRYVKNYTNQLDLEIVHRNQLQTELISYLAEQEEQLQLAEGRVKKYKAQHKKTVELLEQVEKHMASLPDVIDENIPLPPLPTLYELFNRPTEPSEPSKDTEKKKSPLPLREKNHN